MWAGKNYNAQAHGSLKEWKHDNLPVNGNITDYYNVDAG